MLSMLILSLNLAQTLFWQKGPMKIWFNPSFGESIFRWKGIHQSLLHLQDITSVPEIHLHKKNRSNIWLLVSSFYVVNIEIFRSLAYG